MNNKLSPRLAQVIDALPLYKGIRVLEIGCGTGSTAREIARRLEEGHILAIDRSGKAIQMAIKNSQKEISSGRLSFRQIAAEEFELTEGEALFDIAFAIRVGALDGRHPKIGELALSKISKALTKSGRLFIDGGNPLREISLTAFRR